VAGAASHRGCPARPSCGSRRGCARLRGLRRGGCLQLRRLLLRGRRGRLRGRQAGRLRRSGRRHRRRRRAEPSAAAAALAERLLATRARVTPGPPYVAQGQRYGQVKQV